MTRRLVTAREQYELLSPWRTAGQYHPDYNIVSYPATTSGHENIVARDHDGNLAGFINVSPGVEGERYVSGLSVEPEHRRNGLGTALWEAAGRPLHDPQEQSSAGREWAKAVGGGDRRYAAQPWLPHRLNPDPTNPFDEQHYNPDRPRLNQFPDDMQYADDQPLPHPDNPDFDSEFLNTGRGWPKKMEPHTLYRGVRIDLDHPRWQDHPNVQGMKQILFGEHSGHGLYDLPQGQGTLHPHPESPEGQAFSQHLLDFMEDTGQKQNKYRTNVEGDDFTKIHDTSNPTWLGRHWTTDPIVAEDYAHPGRLDTEQPQRGRTLHVMMTADWDGRGEDLNRSNSGGSWEDENEINLAPGAQLNVRGLGIRHGHEWNEKQYTDDWHNTLSQPQTRTAGAKGSLPPMTMEPFGTMWSNGVMARHAEDGRPLGHLHWYPDGEIESVRVHPDFQRRGVASAMLKHAQSDPDTYESSKPIHHSNQLSTAGRAWANSDPQWSDPGDEYVVPADDNTDNWGWTAVDKYVPAHIPYTGQNEAEMSGNLYPDQPHLKVPYTGKTPYRVKTPGRSAAKQHRWPRKHKGNHPDIPFDKRWGPNHPQHVPGPWER